MRMPFAEESLPKRAAESWRTWLLTGVRRGPIDRRRVRGAHLGIKRMLVEGMRVGDDTPYTWKEFSDALVRQSVGEAMGLLGHREAELVKLAYFGGMTNTEIARHTGMRESMVERRLRGAIDAISRHVERGKSLGRRIIAGVAVWLSDRWANDALHGAVQGAAVAAAAAIIATHPAAAPGAERHAVPATVAPAAAPVVPPLPSPTAPVASEPSTAGSSNGAASLPAPAVPALPTAALPQVQAPAVPLPVSLPPPPPPPAAPPVSKVTSEAKSLL